MTFSAPTTVGSGSSKAGTTLAVTLTAAVPAGRLLVVTVGCDNKNTGDIVGADDIVGVTDSKGNKYTLARGQTNGQGAAQGGVAGTIWYSNITAALTTSDMVTVTNATTDYARAVYLGSYTMTAGNIAEVAGVASGVGDAGVDPPSTTSGLTSGAYLHVGLSVDETTTGAGAYTGFTRLGIIASSGQAAASNVAISHQYVIDTAVTGKTFTPATSVDAVSVLVAFREIVKPPIQAKVWSGSAWVAKPLKVWTGSAWVTETPKVWNGTAWV